MNGEGSEIETRQKRGGMKGEEKGWGGIGEGLGG